MEIKKTRKFSKFFEAAKIADELQLVTYVGEHYTSLFLRDKQKEEFLEGLLETHSYYTPEERKQITYRISAGIHSTTVSVSLQSTI